MPIAANGLKGSNSRPYTAAIPIAIPFAHAMAFGRTPAFPRSASQSQRLLAGTNAVRNKCSKVGCGSNRTPAQAPVRNSKMMVPAGSRTPKMSNGQLAPGTAGLVSGADLPFGGCAGPGASCSITAGPMRPRMVFTSSSVTTARFMAAASCSTCLRRSCVTSSASAPEASNPGRTLLKYSSKRFFAECVQWFMVYRPFLSFSVPSSKTLR